MEFILWEGFFVFVKFLNYSRRPYLTITEQSVKIDIQVDLLILFIGKTRRHNIVNANAELDITVSWFTLKFLKQKIFDLRTISGILKFKYEVD